MDGEIGGMGRWAGENWGIREEKGKQVAASAGQWQGIAKDGGSTGSGSCWGSAE